MTTTDVTTTTPGGTALALAPDQDRFNAAQVAALQQLGVEGAGQGDLDVFFHVCQRTGLDPFARQIYMLSRRTQVDGNWVHKQTIQTGIDGYRVVAKRAARRDGVSYSTLRPVWLTADGEERRMWSADAPPAAAEVTIRLSNGEEHVGVANYREYVQTNRNNQPTSMWAKMPAGQLAKCAEALALRKAFPNDLAGVYVEEELQHLDGPRVVDAGDVEVAPAGASGAERVRARLRPAAAPRTAPAEPEPPAAAAAPADGATTDQVRRIRVGLDGLNVTGPAQFRYISDVINRDLTPQNAGSLTSAEADDVLASIDRDYGGGAA